MKINECSNVSKFSFEENEDTQKHYNIQKGAVPIDRTNMEIYKKNREQN